MKELFQSMGFIALTIFTVATPRKETEIIPLLLVKTILLLFAIAILAILLQRFIKHYRRRRAQPFLQTNSQAIASSDLIKQARANNGQLTIFQVSVRFNIEAQIAEKSLNALVEAGLARRQLNEEGILIYAVHNYLLQQHTKILPEKNQGISTGSIS